jgi:hypothetical protein
MSGALYGCGGKPDLGYAEQLTGHEQNEAIVDPDGTGTEIADPCVGQFAANEINGHEYVLPYLLLPSGVCSPVAVFKPTLDARFSVTQVPVKGGTSVTLTPARDEDPGGALIRDEWHYLAATPIEGGGRPVTRVLQSVPGSCRPVVHLIQDLSGPSAQSQRCVRLGPSAGQVKATLRRLLRPSGKAGRVAQLLRHGGYSFSYAAACAGRLVISWYRGRALVGTVSAAFKKGGPARIKIALVPSGRKLLSRSKRLTLTAKGAFTPNGHSAIRASRTITLKP